MIEQNFDVAFVAALALREKQIQQNYRPIIAVHKWFARRPGTLFRAIILSEFLDVPLNESFYRSNKLNGVKIADPFMGGGTPLIEANRLGCDIFGFDINPMAYWIVKQEIEQLDLESYIRGATDLIQELRPKIGSYYETCCLQCGNTKAQVKYFLWVKVHNCVNCGEDFSLFPGYLISENKRHPKNVILCHSCGDLVESSNLDEPGDCPSCGETLLVKGPAKSGHCVCPNCGLNNQYIYNNRSVPKHKLFAIEYYCPNCKKDHKGRFFKKPDRTDANRFEEAESQFNKLKPLYIPTGPIPSGDESDRLHKWGYKYYHEMFNTRQLLGLELSCRFISKYEDVKILNALATNLSDLLRYQNMLCRYDTMALKSLDIFSVHGFPVGLIQCESNFLGIRNENNTGLVGSGGWLNIINKFIKAKSYCNSPFEIRHLGNKNSKINTVGEWIGERNEKYPNEIRNVQLQCDDATQIVLPLSSLDAVLTDPPYFGNVQYAELMDFCYVWLRKLTIDNCHAFEKQSTRDPNELTINENMNRGLEHFTEGLCAIFKKMAAALKPGALLAFTYHHNAIEAYFPIAVAILDSDFISTASIPSPSEMNASIHINGTNSSRIDTLFICRSAKSLSCDQYPCSPEEIAKFVDIDISNLIKAKLKPKRGDIRCIAYGHMIRSAIAYLSTNWDNDKSTKERLNSVRLAIEEIGELDTLQRCLKSSSMQPIQSKLRSDPYPKHNYKVIENETSF
jgi:putative DNA methylase